MAQKQNVKPTTVKVTEVKPNPNNPRVIKDDKFNLLVKSIKDFPQMLELRPIVVDENNVVLGGNMRLRAVQEAGYTEVPIIKVTTLTEEQKREFIIKDNIAFGEWDVDVLANEWSDIDLSEWGLTLWQSEDIAIDTLTNENADELKAPKFKIVLEYDDATIYNELIEAFTTHKGSRETIVYRLLCG